MSYLELLFLSKRYWANALCLGALVQAAFALRKLSATAPKQESHAFSSYTEESELIPGSDMPHLEHPTVSAVGSRSSSVSKGWRVLLAGFLLLFLLPWPNLISSDSPDFLELLITWGLAGIVGIITAWLVKSSGKKQAQRATPQPRRGLPLLLRFVILPLPFLIFTMWVIAHILVDTSPGLPVRPVILIACLLTAGLVSGMTVLIVKIRFRWQRLGTAVKLLSIFLLNFLYAFMLSDSDLCFSVLNYGEVCSSSYTLPSLYASYLL